MNIWFIIFLGVALIYDIREFRIPNWWIAVGTSVTVFLCYYEGRAPSQMLAGFLIPFLFCILLFWFGCLGGGDVKLLMVCGIAFGWAILSFMFYSFLLNGVYAVLFLWKSRSFHRRFSYLFHYISKSLRSRRLTPYVKSNEEVQSAQIHFSVGVFLAYVTLMIGGSL